MKFKTVCCMVFLMAFTILSEAQTERSPSPDGATVEFSNLADGDVVPPKFTVVFNVSGMGIAPAGVQIDNTGHHHLLIDVAELPDLSQPLPATDSIIHFGKGQSETELHLAEGQHTLQLVLADYRHIPHEPPVVSDKIRITVNKNAAAPQNDKENR